MISIGKSIFVAFLHKLHKLLLKKIEKIAQNFCIVKNFCHKSSSRNKIDIFLYKNDFTGKLKRYHLLN